MIANCESMAYYLISVFSAKPLLVAYSMALFDNGINRLLSTSLERVDKTYLLIFFGPVSPS